MKEWQITLVTAFGRGEPLALALIDKGFSVRVLDFTSALPESFTRDSGPFPLVEGEYLPEHRHLLDAAEKLERGLAFWLKDGPLELDGPMADFFLQNRPEVQVWKNDASTSDFETGWLKRFLHQWAAPVLREPWTETSAETFPATETLRLLPHTREARVFSFERAHTLGHEYHACQSLLDLQTESRQLQRLEVATGRNETWESSRWIWALSSLETRILNVKIADQLFPAKQPRADWVWMSFEGHSLRGPWSAGIPEYVLLFNDVFLPWVYANTAVMRRTEDDRYLFWVKVPFERSQSEDNRRKWAADLARVLNTRLPQAKWALEPETWKISPHGLIFSSGFRASSTAYWKNWHWLAPETVKRLDPASRFQLEVEIFQDLLQWRLDRIKKLERKKKKEGAERDRALHAP